ncbi:MULTISPECIES: multidrug effflux MFS transporter [unclassified Meiothermus]|uniref:multidrug effflux MFS transporter n=1 Tax=unclassified Meiothermus TaxID=370471 RepID=UPI000D7CA78A|nr:MULTISPECIES: multidrug effflux MFS transporter [unclassified Meiothermus]PZA06015.1 MFS transporter [Meiothermus sp. Pnk-1]RYM35237.1 MFS transporter [Meiothermus sp. PNK-Is4]
MRPREEILFLGTLMALGAFSTDIMLPALEATALRYDTTLTAAQLVVGVYFLGFALGQLLWGSLMDAWGRRGVLRLTLLGFALAGLATTVAPSFELLLLGRGVQGFLAASFRIGVTASIRDRYRGQAMARLLSYALLVLTVAPVLAPSLGVGLLALGPKAPYALPAVLGTLAFLWSGRFQETLPPQRRRPLAWSTLREGAVWVVRDRRAGLYTLALGGIFGILYAYLSASAQLYKTHLGLSNPAFALAFGATGLLMAGVNLTGPRWVARLGLGRALQLALGTLFVGVLLLPLHALLALRTFPFWLHLSLILLLVAFTFPNAQARALEELGKVAGLAASLTGFLSTLLATLLGTWVGQASGGEPFRFALGLLLLGTLAFLAGAWAEAKP